MTIQRIVLACSGLEKARDGVGDYCRRLALAMRSVGVDCALLALNDSRIGQPERSVLEDSGGTIPILRLPRRDSREKKREAAATFLAEFKPDFVSLQFVSYGFNPKGIVFSDIGWLSALFAPYRLELMGHEIWIGTETQPSFKNIVVGIFQREAIRRLIVRLKPAVVHTTNVRYAKFYQSIGVEAGILPLFGNIPVGQADGSNWILPALELQGFSGIAARRSDYWLFGMFGAAVSQWPFAEIFKRLSDIARRANRIPAVVAFGIIGSASEQIIAAWRTSCPDMKFAWLGPQPAQKVSEIMNAVDFAISSHQNYALGKSGSAAAFLEHGVPVITNWGYDPAFPVVVDSRFSNLVWNNDALLEGQLLNPPARIWLTDHAKQIALGLLSDLRSHT